MVVDSFYFENSISFKKGKSFLFVTDLPIANYSDSASALLNKNKQLHL